MLRRVLFVVLLLCGGQALPAAQATAPGVAGHVTDDTGGALPGVTVELRSDDDGGSPQVAVTDGGGDYSFTDVTPGRYQVGFTLVNFASVTRRAVEVGQGRVRVDATMQLSLNAEVVVVGKRTFANLADVENPAENLVGIAQSASQGAITAQQLDVRPFMRQGEVLELFNLANARVSDIDDYFASRLPGEPVGGVYDIHTHPAVPRTVRVSMIVGF